MNKLAALSALVLSLLSAACSGDAPSVGTDVVAAEPAVLVGGFADPVAPVGGRKAEYPIAGQDLELSDGAVSYRVMFGRTVDGAAVVARINEEASATITASLSDEGRLVLTSVETGVDAEITVVRGTAIEGLGLVKGESAFGQ